MIFKTFENNDIDKWTAKIGLFGKSFNDVIDSINKRKLDIDNLMSSGLVSSYSDAKKQVGGLFSYLYSKKDIKSQLIDVDSVFPKIDENQAKSILKQINDIENGVNEEIKSFQELYDTGNKQKQWIAKYAQETQGQIRSTEDLISANQKARTSAIAHNNALKQQTLGAKAANVAMKGLAMAGNMLLMYGLTSLIEIIYDCATASDRLAESAAQMGSEFAFTKSDITDYKTKIEELYTTINDNTSSYEDTYNARQELLKIQDEMIKKFGDEADAVGLVTDAINGQTDSLDTLTQKEWQETVNAFNSDRGKSWKEKIANTFTNIVHGGNNFQRMIDEMENTKVTFHMVPMYGDDTYKEFSKKLKKDFGADITRTERDDAITLSGDLDTIYKQLLNIQSLAKGMGIKDNYLKDLGDQADKVKSNLDKYQDMYSSHILYDKIFSDTKTLNNVGKTYEESFNEINKAYKKYQDTFATGDEDAIAKAKQSYAEIVQGAIEGLDENDNVIDYFNNMYPDLQEVVGGWEFEVKFKAAIEDDSDDFEKEVQEAASKFDTIEELKNIDKNPEVATDEQKEAYLQLKQYADNYNLSLDQLIDKLTQLGLIRSQSKADLLNKLIPSKSTPTAGITSVLINAANNINPDEVEKWVDSLTDEEAKLANSPEFDKALEKQKEKINSIPESLKEAQENLEKEYQKISAWGLDDYADQIKNGTIQTKFGNVDMDKRTIINWSDELKQTYADALASWDYDPEVGTIDTVFGASERFGEGFKGHEEGWEIAFTPILPDGTFLSKDTVEEYIKSILQKAYSDDGKVTDDELKKIDEQGLQIGNTFVKGIYAGIDDSQNYDNNGNWAELVGRLMHFSGDFGAVKLANDAIDEESKSMDIVTLSVKNFTDALEELINAQKKASKEPPVFSDIFSLKDTNDTLTTLGKISKSIDTIQNAYNTLNSAIEEYNDSESISIDALQSIIALGDDWYDYLLDENGALKLDKESLQALTLSRLADMKAQIQQNMIDSVKKINDDASAKEYLASTNYKTADSIEAVTNAMIDQALAEKRLLVDSGDLSQENYDLIAKKLRDDIEKSNLLFGNISLDDISLSGGSSSSNSKSNSKDSIDIIDFAEEKLNHLNTLIDDTQKHLEQLEGSASKNALTDSLIDINNSKMNTLEQVSDLYTRMANEYLAKIPEQYKGLAKEGGLEIDKFIGDGNSKVADAIKNYQTWADKVDDINSQLIELKQTLKDLEVDKFNNIKDDFDSMYGILDKNKSKIKDVVSLLETQEQNVGQGFYEELIAETKSQIQILKEERDTLTSQMTSALRNGIEYGSNEWKDMYDALEVVHIKVLNK